MSSLPPPHIFFLWLNPLACGVLVPWTRDGPPPSSSDALEGRVLNYWGKPLPSLRGQLWALGAFTWLWSLHPFTEQAETLHSLSTDSSFLSPPVSSVFLDLTARCRIWVKSHSDLSFCVLLISLSILSSGFIHDVACVRTSFWVWISSIVWLTPFCFIHQLMDT